MSLQLLYQKIYIKSYRKMGIIRHNETYVQIFIFFVN